MLLHMFNTGHLDCLWPNFRDFNFVILRLGGVFLGQNVSATMSRAHPSFSLKLFGCLKNIYVDTTF